MKQVQQEVIRRCSDTDFDYALAVINDSARSYKGVIPDDCMHEPYMTKDELMREVSSGVEFWLLSMNSLPCAVMGIQYLNEVTLIRHAYVRSPDRRRGIGGRLLDFLLARAVGPVLVGTWSAAGWAIKFYEKHGFRLIGEDEHAELLKRYWNVTERHMENSVVLANTVWFRS